MSLDEALEVRAALVRLPGDSREVLERFFVLDQSYRTISDALGIPSGTVASRTSRTLAKLRTEPEELAEQVEGHVVTSTTG